VRKKLIAANWKMNLVPVEARALVAGIRAELDPDAATLAQDRDILIAPADILIPDVSEALAGSSILLGAQNMHYEDKGAFTGEVSPPMLLAYGVSYVIIGHSERRHIFHESDELINRKVVSALKHGLTPILSVGETLEQHAGGRAHDVVLGQMRRGLAGVADGHITALAIAYEPVWAIGTGHFATPEQAEAIHRAIRGSLMERYGQQRASEVRIIYGGSVTPENVDSLVSRAGIDGALVGGASLKASSFARIARARIR